MFFLRTTFNNFNFATANHKVLRNQKLYKRHFALELTFEVKDPKKEECDISRQFDRQLNISYDFDAIKCHQSAAFQADCQVYSLGGTKISVTGQQSAENCDNGNKAGSVIGGLDDVIDEMNDLISPFQKNES